MVGFGRRSLSTIHIAVVILSFQNHGYDLSVLVSKILERVLISFDGVILPSFSARQILSIYCRIQKSLFITTVLDWDIWNDLYLFLNVRIQFWACMRTNNILNKLVQLLSLITRIRLQLLILFLVLEGVAFDQDRFAHVLIG